MTTKGLYTATAVLLVLLAGCAKSQVAGPNSSDRQSEKQRCTAGAKSLLGQSASVVRCGDLIGTGGLEAPAVTPLPNSPQPGGALAASRVVVIRQQGSEWITELDAAKDIMTLWDISV
jgi:hypothetical protein